MSRAITAAELGVAEAFNAATHFVDRHVREGRGSVVAIECGEERVTYAQLLDGVNRFGSALRDALEVRPEERVMLLLLDTPAFATVFFGAIKIGAVPIPTNTLWTPADYRHVLNDSRARVAVVSEELLPQIAQIPRGDLPGLRHIVVVGRAQPPAGMVSFADLIDRGSSELDADRTSRDAPAFWLYSSGSTGAPKGCPHLHHDMVVCAELFGKGVLQIAPADRFFSVAKLFFAYGLGNALYFPLAVGGTSILSPGPPTATNAYAVIERHRPSLLFSVPTGFGMLLSQPGAFDLTSVRLAVSAGEALPPAMYERFKARFGIDILDGIGSTEALHMFISNRPGAIRPGSSGQIVPGYDASILDEDRRPVPDGEVGNLWVTGDSVCAGYWNQHEKTKSTIEGAWIRTGDRYSRDAEGFYWYAGRTDDMLKVGGQWVSPIEVEHALVAHDAVQECGVVGREDGDRLIKPMAFVVLRAGVDASPALAAELQEFVRLTLADYKRPRWVEFVPDLPRTATGKLQRFKLRPL
ncbi:MAG TPA: benzoate-CoA ligase family protein [Vicinamibacterales bacterium]